MPLTLQDIVKKLMSYRSTLWFRVSYLILLGVITSALFRFLFSGSATACLGIFLIPVVIFIFPYWLGERSSKNFILNVIPVFLVAALLIATFQTTASTDPTPIVLEAVPTPDFPSALSIYNGTVTPFKAPGPTTFNFTMRVVGDAGVNMSLVAATLNLTPIQNLGASATETYPMTWDAARGYNNTTRWYYRQMTLGPTIYEFNFYANDSKGNQTQTVAPLGPITAPELDYYTLWLYITVLYLLIPFSFYFIIIFMFWYTGRMRRMRSRMIDVDAKKKAGPEGTAEKAAEAGTTGTATRKPAGFTCTNCGADVTEDDEKCPKCGAVFED